MSKLFNTKLRNFAKKYRAVQMLGGKCEICGDDNFYHLIFHHINRDDKEKEISKLKSYRWSKIEKEIKKCKLLCHNCHNEFHYNEESTYGRLKDNKKLYLEIKDIYSCEICGYSKCNNSLHFHHINKDDKDFSISEKCKDFRTIENVPDNIIEELKKCQVICSNCHGEKHSNFFEIYKDLIIEKSKNLKELREKIDEDLIKRMYLDENKSQIEISKIIGCKKNTISMIVKRLNINREEKLTSEEISIFQSLYNELGSLRKVAKKVGWSRQVISKYVIIKNTPKQTPDERKKSTGKNVMKWRKDKLLKLIEYKGGCCQNCKSEENLSFHNLNEGKDFMISTKSFDKMKKEVDDCVLLCKECHKECHKEIKKEGYSEIVNKIKK